MNLTRRQWIWLASAASAGQLLRGPYAYGGTHFSQIRGDVGHPTDPLFIEVSPSASGITWLHENAMSPSRYLPEALGPGCAFLDFDNDGWTDIFLVNSGPSDFWKPTKPVRNALYKNNRDGTFTDVTEKAGVGGTYFGMGVAVGDFDNDGWPDLFVTAVGGNRLFRNVGGKRFEEVTAAAGFPRPVWPTGTSDEFLKLAGPISFPSSAAFLDYDGDGRFVGLAYADARPRGGMGIDAAEVLPGQFAVVVANFSNEPNSLFRRTHPNPLRFADEAGPAGLATPTRAPMKFGAVFADFDLD